MCNSCWFFILSFAISSSSFDFSSFNLAKMLEQMSPWPSESWEMTVWKFGTSKSWLDMRVISKNDELYKPQKASKILFQTVNVWNCCLPWRLFNGIKTNLSMSLDVNRHDLKWSFLHLPTVQTVEGRGQGEQEEDWTHESHDGECFSSLNTCGLYTRPERRYSFSMEQSREM